VDTTIHTVDSLESVDQRLSRGPFTHISPSPNGKSLVLLTFNGTLWVVSSDFQRSMAEFNTSDVPAATGSVRQIEWCGNDAILVTWDSLAILVGPFGDTLQYVDVVCIARAGTYHSRSDIFTQAPPQLSLRWMVYVSLAKKRPISSRRFLVGGLPVVSFNFGMLPFP